MCENTFAVHLLHPAEMHNRSFLYSPDMHFTVSLKEENMKSFFNLFYDSGNELKKAGCLATTGLLIALFVVLDFASFRVGSFLKINFAFVSLSVIGMLFGPVPGMLAALAGDLIGCIISGQAPLPLLSLTAVLEGCLYGVMLYKKDGVKLAAMSAAARCIDSLVINLVLNTLILMSVGFMSKTWEQFVLRTGKNVVEMLVYAPLLAAFLPAVAAVYKRVRRTPAAK